MRPISARLRRHRSRAGWSRRDVRWALLGGTALVLLGAIVTSFAADGQLAAIVRGKLAGAPPPAQDIFREGSILFVSRNSSVCRKQVIDNKTGQIGNARLVNCNGGPADDVTKVDAFRDGFQRK